jgi:predicted outer membrane repeat protein
MKLRILTLVAVLLSVSGLASAAERRVPSRTYPTIQSAVDAAAPGDVVILAPNPTGTYGVWPNAVTYNGVYTGGGNWNINPGGKAIIIRSDTNADNPDPAVVAATIIDCAGSRYAPHRAFIFNQGEGPDTMIIGLTLRNGWARGPKGVDYQLPGDRYRVEGDNVAEAPVTGENGGSASGDGFGGGILCDGSSPTIKYCIIENCTVTGAQGGNGRDGLPGTWPHPFPPDANEPLEFDDGQWGGRGGDGDGYGRGGAVACTNSSMPLISNCTIRNNTARGGVGGDGGDGGIAADNGTNGLESQGGDGGNGFGSGLGGGIYTDGDSDPTILDCTVSNNVATQGLGGFGGLRGEGEPDDQADPPISDGADGGVGDCFEISGGAAFLGSATDANFTNCTFNANGAYLSFDTGFTGTQYFYGGGGAIYTLSNNSIILKNSQFNENAAGAICGEASLKLDIIDCGFTDNYGAYYGGAIWLDHGSSVDIIRSDFTGNSTDYDGGAIESASDLTITDCSFSGNNSPGYGGAIDLYYSGTQLNIDALRCSFSSNEAEQGGAFSSAGFIAFFTDCYFSGNMAETGGAIDAEYGNLGITGGKFSANRSTYGNGGAISCLVTDLTMADCTLEKNSAEGTTGRGGAISLEGKLNGHSIINSVFT